MSYVTLFLSDDDSITMDSTTTGKYAAKRVADHLGYDDDYVYELYVQTEKGSTRIGDDEIVAEYDNYSVSRLKVVQ